MRTALALVLGVLRLPECHQTHRVAFQVESPEGPVAGCVVRMWDGENLRTAATDLKGSAHIDLLDDARHVVVEPVVQPFDTVDGTVVLRLPKGERVTGRLVVTGGPAGPLRLTSQLHPHGAPVVAVTDADGGFSFVTCPGPFVLTVNVFDGSGHGVHRQLKGTAPAELELTVDVPAELEALDRRRKKPR